MRPQDIVIGKSYRLKDSPDYGYIKVVELLKPRQGVNKHNYFIVKSEHSVRENDTMGFVRYFRPRDLNREEW
ncbi:MAG: hypothetical protein KAV18_01260 [Candidatus Omnitrophica bacterium]|nr:hypothetical protein [Candidatus Omnitrophota bacterium]